MNILILSKDNVQHEMLNRFIKQNISFKINSFFATSLQESKKLIQSEKPSVILSYFFLSDGSLFKLIEDLDFSPRKCFMLERRQEFAIKAIRVGIAGMIDFPAEQDELISFLHKSKDDFQIRALEKSVSELKSSNCSRIIIKTDFEIEKIDVSELIMLRQKGNHVICQLNSRQVIIKNCQLKELIDKINAESLFQLTSELVINRTGLKKIEEIQKGYKLTFDNNLELQINTQIPLTQTLSEIYK